MPAVSGSTTQVRTSAATPGDLAGTPDDSFEEGDFACVRSLWPNSTFRLRRSAIPAPADDVTTIDTFSGNGYWEVFGTGGGGGLLVFPTIADLAAYVDTSLLDGALVYVQSVRSYWSRLVQADPGTADGITNVQNPSNTATWYRDEQASPSWLNTASWYIDNVGGDDEGSGSITEPLETHDEFMRRIGDNKLTQDLNVTFTTVFDGNFSHVMLPNQQAGFAVNYTAALDTSDPIITGVFDNFNPLNHIGSGNRTSFTNDTYGEPAWTAAIGKFILVTSGASAGSYAWITAAEAGEGFVSVYTSPFIQASVTNVDPSVVDPADLDSYVVIDLLPLTCDDFFVSVSEKTLFPADISPVTFSNIALGTTKRSTISDASNVSFFACDLEALTFLDSADVANWGCHLLNGIIVAGSANYTFSAGYVDGLANTGAILLDSAGAHALVDGDTVLNGPDAFIDVAANAQIALADVGIFDCGNALVTLYHHANASISGAIYGDGNTNFIFQLSALSSVIDNSADLLATSSVAVVSFGDAITKSWVQLPFIANALVTDSQAAWVNG